MSGGRIHLGGGGLLHEYGITGGNLGDEAVRDAISVGYSWNYFTTTLPTGADSSKLICLYQFDGPDEGLTDRTGNGHDLTVNRDVFWAHLKGSLGINAVQFRDNTNSEGPVRLFPGTTGAWTVEWLWSPIAWTTAADFIFAVYGAGETEASNVTVDIIVAATNGQIGVHHERGAGSNVSGNFSFTGLLGHIQYGAVTRNADGVTHKLYSDGDYVETLVLDNPPTGGDGADVHVAVGGGDTDNDLYAYLFSIRYVQEEYSAAQILESYNAVRGF